MAVVQNAYSERTGTARIGQVANTQTCDVDSYLVKETAGIPYGRAVRLGADYNEVLIGVANNNFVGIAVKDITRGPEEDNGFDVNTHLGAMWRGDVWVESFDAVSAGDRPYARSKDGRIGGAVGSSQLNGALTDSATTVTVDTGTQFAVGDVVNVDDEQMLVTARAGNNLTVTRAYNSTTAAAHADNAPIAAGFAISGGRFMKAAAIDALTVVRLAGTLPAA